MRIKIITVLMSTFMITSFFMIATGLESNAEGESSTGVEISYVSHASIDIRGDADFTQQAISEGWQGNGTSDNPFVIEKYDIDGSIDNYCIWVDFTTVHFIVKDCYLHSAWDGGVGLGLTTVQNCIMDNNTITNNYWGIYLNNASSSDIFCNTVSSNNNGIWMEVSSGNMIYHNSFINNTAQAYSDRANVWNDTYPSGGNYWSDWTSPDIKFGVNQDKTGSDGIVDSPRAIVGWTSQDRYPLTKPNGWPASSWPVHNIDTDEYFTTIQSAIDDLETLGGHTIEMEKAIYNEHVVVNKRLTLVGEDRNTTVIDGNGAGVVVYISANWVNISGFHITNGTYGVYSDGYSNYSITSNIFSGCEKGIYTNSSMKDLYHQSSTTGINYPNDFDVFNRGNRTIVAAYLAGKVLLYNTKNKFNPQLIDSIGIRGAHDVKVLDSEPNYAYFVNRTGFGIINMTNEKDMFVEDYIALSDAFYNEVYNISGSIIVFVVTYISNGLYIYNVTNHTINLLDSITGGGANYDLTEVWRTGYHPGYKLLITGAAGTNGHVSVFNVSDLTNIVPINKYDGARWEWFNLDIEGDLVYGTASSNDTIVVASILANGTLSYLGNYTDSIHLDNCHGIDVENSIIYAASWFNDGIAILDATDAGNITYVTGVYGAGPPYYLDSQHAIEKSGDYIFSAGAYQDALVIFLYGDVIDSLNKYINNTIVNCTYGMYFEKLYNSRIIGNNITGNTHGIYISSSNNNIISNNIVSSNTLNGIHLDSSSNNKIANNTMVEDGLFISGKQLTHWNTHTIDITNTVNGKPLYYWKNRTSGFVPEKAGQIILANCSGIMVENQNLSDGTVGLELGFSNTNILVNNTISLNKYYGIYLDYSNSNTIYHNSFINNFNQTYDYGANLWDNNYPSGGNYWDDYSGIDIMSGSLQSLPGSDSIGDTQYTIDTNSTDHYPLMQVWISPPLREFNTNLTAGWNLLSIPLVMTNTFVENVLSSIPGKWDVVKYYDTNDKADPWKTYRSGFLINDLANIEGTMGFWIHAISACNLTVTGTMPVSTDIILYTGWNLVGYPSETTRLASSTLPAEADKISVWQAVSPYVQDFTDISQVTMSAGNGYWVHATADCVWTVDW